jgi:hypothetical protein
MAGDEVEIGLTWDEWKARLIRLGAGFYGPDQVVVAIGEDYWRNFFDEGFSPMEAYQEDQSNWRRENPHD